MPKKPTIIQPIDAEFEELTKAVVGRSTDDAIESFVKLTQEDMKNEANRPKDLLNNLSEGDTRLVLFKGINIRSVFHDNSWWFSVVDVIEAIAESGDRSRQYWSDLKKRLMKEGYSELYEKIVQLKMIANDGKLRETDCVDTETLFRLIQSIPSKKAEPFKIWLAKVGSERVDETQDPELAFDRAMQTYLKKGYSKEWVNQRLKTIEVRKELTDEWNRVGIHKKPNYAILTDEITKAWSGKTVKEYKYFKNLKKENLCDNMINLEFVLNMLAEATTTELSKKKDPKYFSQSKTIAKQGGKVAGNTRKDIEKKLGEKIISSKNMQDLLEKKSKKKLS